MHVRRITMELRTIHQFWERIDAHLHRSILVAAVAPLWGAGLGVLAGSTTGASPKSTLEICLVGAAAATLPAVNHAYGAWRMAVQLRVLVIEQRPTMQISDGPPPARATRPNAPRAHRLRCR